MKELCHLDKNGVGMCYYSTGEIAVNVVKKDGGQHLHFFNNDAKHTMIASFTIPDGEGFVSYRSGKPRLVVNKTGLRLCTEQGNTTEKWNWYCRGKYTGPTKEISFSINGAFHFRLARPDDMTINYRNIQRIFNVGQQPFKTVKHKRLTKMVNGKVVAPTLIERQIRQAKKHLDEDPFEEIHARNLSYPKLSASGRELKSVQMRPELRLLEAHHEETMRRIESGEFSSSITKKIKFHSSLRGANALQATIAAVGAGGPDLSSKSRVPGHNLPKPPKWLPDLLTIKDAKFFQFLPDWSNKSENNSRMIAAVFSDKLTKESRRMEVMLQSVLREWEAQEKAKRAAQNNPYNAGERAGAKRTRSLLKRTVIKDPFERFQLALVDCSQSANVAKKYQFHQFPMCFMFFRQRIVFARNTFANCGVDRDSFLRQLETAYRKALSGVFLPDTFKFNSRWNNQGGLNEQKQAVWAHSGLR